MQVFLKNLTAEQRRIRDDLLKQLELREMNTSYYQDLVNDYLVMMQTRDKLQRDIEERGTLIYYCNGGGQEGFKKNDSIDSFNKICDRMIKHLEFLGINPNNVVQDGGDNKL